MTTYAEPMHDEYLRTLFFLEDNLDSINDKLASKGYMINRVKCVDDKSMHGISLNSCDYVVRKKGIRGFFQMIDNNLTGLGYPAEIFLCNSKEKVTIFVVNRLEIRDEMKEVADGLEKIIRKQIVFFG